MNKIGRDERIRTSDPHTPSVMRYQAALRPDREAISHWKFPVLRNRINMLGPIWTAFVKSKVQTRYPLRAFWRHDNGPPLE